MPQRILIVDDEEGMRLALKEVLLRAGYDIEVADNGRAALDRLNGQSSGQLPLDLVLSDVRMPEIDGMELLNKISGLQNPPPVVIMTAFGTIEDAVDTMRRGARDYILKPFSPDSVLDVIGRVLNEQQLTKAEADSAPAETGATAEAEATETDRPAPARRNGSKKEIPFIAVDQNMKHLLQMAREVADSDATILILGESGTGKEVLARFIHQHSTRRDKPFVAFNCAALPEGLAESELFGHIKGSFTGAILNRKGQFELAQHGSILLDEISEMPPALQAKLLRVLQEREIVPVGSGEAVRLDIRVIATSNRKLEACVEDGTFRQDLYYRLNVITIELPPLRERQADILPLANHFLNHYCRRNRRPAKKFGRGLEQYLLDQPWNGNVRELENFIERAVLLSKDSVIEPEGIFLGRLTLGGIPKTANNDSAGAPAPSSGLDYGAKAPPTQANVQSLFSGPTMTLEEMERNLILSTLERVNGNRTKAADMLGVSVRTIRNKLHQYELAKA